MEKDIAQEVISNAVFRMRESTRMVGISLEQLSEEDVWKRPNSASNSVGNLILHLCGNITQYAIASLGELKDTREREAEFAQTSGFSKEQLWAKLQDTVNKACSTMEAASLEQLLEKREVQGFNFSGIGVIMHVVEHYSYHTGQIAFWTKIVKDKDLGFYDGLDLTIKNKPKK
ncbi:DinB family protein [Spongiimicrobium sp. 3-5]|uniref:DinB family protein n=1 Tax=Spongiimicrobium sp. 3-5 TaxID=3332596 RepID=UPI003980649D